MRTRGGGGVGDKAVFGIRRIYTLLCVKQIIVGSFGASQVKHIVVKTCLPIQKTAKERGLDPGLGRSHMEKGLATSVLPIKSHGAKEGCAGFNH